MNWLRSLNGFHLRMRHKNSTNTRVTVIRLQAMFQRLPAKASQAVQSDEDWHDRLAEYYSHPGTRVRLRRMRERAIDEQSQTRTREQLCPPPSRSAFLYHTTSRLFSAYGVIPYGTVDQWTLWADTHKRDCFMADRCDGVTSVVGKQTRL